MASQPPDKQEERLFLLSAFPALSKEIEQLLCHQEEHALAAQVPQLRIYDRCRCGDDFCATMYTQIRTKDGYRPGYRTLDLGAKSGFIALDVVEERIVCIEVLYRDEIRNGLLRLMP